MTWAPLPSAATRQLSIGRPHELISNAIVSNRAGSAAPSPRAAGAAEPARFETIAFEINSWGRPIDSWRVAADGSGAHVKMVQDEGADFRTYRLEHRQFTVSPEDYARLADMAAELPQPRLKREDCELRATDLPYGNVRLGGAAGEETIGFDVGCRDAPYQEFVARLRAMDELVTEWAERHPPVRIEEPSAD